MRARWKDCAITKLKAGEAFIGDWKEAGLPSEMAYRCAKKILHDCRLATFRGTNKGTRAILSDDSIFSLTAPANNGQANIPTNAQPTTLATSQQRPENGPTTTKHTEHKEHPESPITQRGEAFAPHPFDVVPPPNRPQYEELIKKIQAVKTEWKSGLTHEELQDLRNNAGSLQSQTEEDWKTFREWLFAKIEQGDAAKKPSKRCWFIKSPAGYFEAALQWKRKHPSKVEKSWETYQRGESTPDHKPAPEDVASRKDMAEMFKAFRPGGIGIDLPPHKNGRPVHEPGLGGRQPAETITTSS